jgi:hypothetical protein
MDVAVSPPERPSGDDVGAPIADSFSPLGSTRPLDASFGDFLDNPVAKGGLDSSRPVASIVLIVLIVLIVAVILLVLLLPQHAG